MCSNCLLESCKSFYSHCSEVGRKFYEGREGVSEKARELLPPPDTADTLSIGRDRCPRSYYLLLPSLCEGFYSPSDFVAELCPALSR